MRFCGFRRVENWGIHIRCLIYLLVLIANICLVPIPLVLAEQPLTGKMRQLVEDHIAEKNKKNFLGLSGILFYCFFNENSSQTQKNICEQAGVNAEFLAATAKVNLIKTHSAYEVALLAKVEKRLVLEVDLHFTASGSPAAVSARVIAYMDYSSAIEDSPTEIKKDDGRVHPRSGKLIVWEEGVIGASSGTTKELVTPVSEGIEQHLKKFFTDYLKAQR
jgi:hypothetical protein